MNQLLRIFLCFALCVVGAGQLRAADTTPSYDDTLAKARKLMDDGKLAEAYLSASAAITLDDKRWEAYALVGLVLNAQGASADAKVYVDKALDRAPGDKKAALQNIEKKISQPTSTPQAVAGASDLSDEDRRKLNVLMLIAEDADKAQTADARERLLREFLDKSDDFLKSHSDQFSVWLIRAAAAVELEEPKLSWEAGRKLRSFGAESSRDSKTQKIIAMLDRNGWFSDTPPTLTADQYKKAQRQVSRFKEYIDYISSHHLENGVPGITKVSQEYLSGWQAFLDGKSLVEPEKRIERTADGWKITINNTSADGEQTASEPAKVANHDAQDEAAEIARLKIYLSKTLQENGTYNQTIIELYKGHQSSQPELRIINESSLEFENDMIKVHYRENHKSYDPETKELLSPGEDINTDSTCRLTDLDPSSLKIAESFPYIAKNNNPDVQHTVTGQAWFFKFSCNGGDCVTSKVDSQSIGMSHSLGISVSSLEIANQIGSAMKRLIEVSKTGANRDIKEISPRMSMAEQQVANFKQKVEILKARNFDSATISNAEKSLAEWTEFLNGNPVEPKEFLERTDDGGWKLTVRR